MTMLARGIPTLWSVFWRFKGTILILVIIAVIGILTGDQTVREHTRLLHRLGFDYRILTEGHLWHLTTGTWIQSTPGIAWSMVALVFGGTFLLELFAGTSAMLTTCITGDWISTLLTTLTLRVLAHFGDASVSALLSTPDAGTSAFAHAGYGAAVMLLPRRWLKIAIPALVVLTSSQFLYISLAPAIVHCWAALYGALAGWFVLRPRIRSDESEWPWVHGAERVPVRASDTG